MKRHERDVTRLARNHGLVVRHAGGHLRLVDQTTGRFVIASGTPRDPHGALQAIRRDIERLRSAS